MSELSPFQRRVADVLFDLPEADGYALAGGAALILRHVITRETADLDAFIAARPGPDPGSVDALADAFATTAQGFGWTVETARRNPTFCRYFVRSGEDRTEVDLAVDSPPLELPETVDGLPVLTSLDLGGRKVLAIVDRLEARDYTDLHALASLLGRQSGRRSPRRRRTSDPPAPDRRFGLGDISVSTHSDPAVVAQALWELRGHAPPVPQCIVIRRIDRWPHRTGRTPRTDPGPLRWRATRDAATARHEPSWSVRSPG
jgi:Nucleotidyl transferase AbiEii toxin, Type IV TA system